MLFESHEVETLLTSPNNLINKVKELDLSVIVQKPRSPQYRDNVHEMLEDGRRAINPEGTYTTAERSLAAALSQLDTQKNVAKTMGASVSQVQNWANGRMNRPGQTPYSNGEKNPELINETKVKLGKIRDVAMDKLLATLGIIENDSLVGLGAKDLSIVANNLSRVVEKTLPKEEQNNNKVQLIMYSPQQNNITEYNIVEA